MITAVCNQKGGVGKTTIATHLAIGLAKRNKQVLIIDLDPQYNTSTLLVPKYKDFVKELDPKINTVYATIINRQPLPIFQSKIPNLDIVPSHLLLAGADTELAVAKDHTEQRLRKQLQPLIDKYDYIFIDCPPNLGALNLNAFVAADDFIVVVEPGTFSLQAIDQLSKTIEELVKAEYEHNIELKGFLFNGKAATDASKYTYNELKKTFGDLVFRTLIPKNTDLEKAQINLTNVFDLNPKAPASIAFNDLISELYNL